MRAGDCPVPLRQETLKDVLFVLVIFFNDARLDCSALSLSCCCHFLSLSAAAAVDGCGVVCVRAVGSYLGVVLELLFFCLLIKVGPRLSCCHFYGLK